MSKDKITSQRELSDGIRQAIKEYYKNKMDNVDNTQLNYLSAEDLFKKFTI